MTFLDTPFPDYISWNRVFLSAANYGSLISLLKGGSE